MTWAALLARLAPALARARAAAVWVLGHPVAVGRWLWANRLAVLLVLAALLVALSARSCSRADREAARANAAEQAAAAAKEREAARAAAVVPIEPVQDLRPALDAALADNAALQAEVARAKKAVPGAKPVAVIQAQTAPVAAAQPVLLGEQLRLEVDGVELQGPAGARLAVGTASAVRVSDGFLIASGAWSAPVTEAVILAPALRCPDPVADRAWRVGPVGGLGVSGSGGGWLVGAAYTRRLNIWGWKPEVIVTAAAGPGGGTILAGPLF